MTGSELRLVTSHDCHLCLHGRALLDRLGLSAREIDVESEEAQTLAARGVPLALLPVLLDGERLVAYGRFSEKRLRRELGL
jgi:glutaredoxin